MTIFLFTNSILNLLSSHSLGDSQFQPIQRDAARFRSDEKAGQLYGVGGKVKDTTGRLKQDSPLPFLLDLSASARASPLGFHRAHLSLREHKQMDIMNSTSSVKITPASQRIVTHWRRFSSGLWRVPEGDIAAAYCADTFPKISVFTHEGRLFTNCGCNYSKYIAAEVNCYPLITPDEYHGAENVPYSYEGREAAYKGEGFQTRSESPFRRVRAND